MLGNKILIFISLLPIIGARRRKNFHRFGSSDFDYYVLTQLYPTAVCKADDAVMPESCEIPSGTASWTIHGLWPNRNDGSSPASCSNKKFNLDSVAVIEKKLSTDWPNLFPESSKYSFWKHEWEKHGTCSEKDIIQYFNETINLHDVFDIFSILKNHSIIPSEDRSYRIFDIKQAVESFVRAPIEIRCLKDITTNQWLLADVRICLTKKYKPRECIKKRRRNRRSSRKTKSLPQYQPCPEDNIYYIPSDHVEQTLTNSNSFTEKIPETSVAPRKPWVPGVTDVPEMPKSTSSLSITSIITHLFHGVGNYLKNLGLTNL